MAEKNAPIVSCVVCGHGKNVQHSLSLTRDSKGVWVSNPVCPACRKALMADARANGKFIPFFGIEASRSEAAKRNGQVSLNRPFLEKFGRALTEKAKTLEKVPRPKLVRAANG